MNKVLSALLLSFFCQCLSAVEIPQSAVYVGSQNCQSCHRTNYNDWLESDHYRSMQPAEAAFVKGDFSGAEIVLEGVSWRFFIKDTVYTVETT